MKKVHRKSYTREFKLSVIAFYRSHNLYQTSKKYELNTKTILRWAASEMEISKSTKGSKHCHKHHKPDHPEMEAAILEEFKEMRRKGLKVKRYWFKFRARQLLAELEPDNNFKFSNGWFDRFKARNNISLRRATNTAQKPATDKLSLIRNFHSTIRREAKPSNGENVFNVGRFKLHQVANKDQTPLPFTFASGETYNETGERTVWVRGGASGLDKRQCTVQLTVFADGEARVKPLLIFMGTGARIPLSERVSVMS